MKEHATFKISTSGPVGISRKVWAHSTILLLLILLCSVHETSDDKFIISVYLLTLYGNFAALHLFYHAIVKPWMQSNNSLNANSN